MMISINKTLQKDKTLSINLTTEFHGVHHGVSRLLNRVTSVVTFLLSGNKYCLFPEVRY